MPLKEKVSHFSKSFTKSLIYKTFLYVVKLKQVNKGFFFVQDYKKSYSYLLTSKIQVKPLGKRSSEILIAPADKVLSHQKRGVCVKFRTEGRLKFSAYFKY